MPAGPLTVVIADDSGRSAEMLTELVGVPGRIVGVGVGATEQATIDSIRTLKPDVAFLDLQPRNGSGAAQ